MSLYLFHSRLCKGIRCRFQPPNAREIDQGFLEPGRTVSEDELIVHVVFGLVHAVVPHYRRVQSIQGSFPAIKDSGADRAQKPFVASGGQKIDLDVYAFATAIRPCRIGIKTAPGYCTPN